MLDLPPELFRARFLSPRRAAGDDGSMFHLLDNKLFLSLVFQVPPDYQKP